MGRTYKVGPSGSFGARYGTVARKQYATVISGLRGSHECPQCHMSAVKRLSVGIWLCGRCGYKFTGGAYTPRTKLGEIAERAVRTGAAATLMAELRAEKARALEAEAKAKAPMKRRRKRVVAKEPAETSKAAEETPQDKTE